MDSIIYINLILVAVFILLTGLFVGGEFAILKVRMSRIDQLISEGNKKAVLAKKVAHELDYYLSACQLGITITALVLGALGEPTVQRLLRPVFDYYSVPDAMATALSFAIALAIVTFLHVVIGELAPKTLAIQFPEKMTLLLAPPLYWFGVVMGPFIRILNGSARSILGWFGVKPAGHETVYSEEELKLIVADSYKGGEINQTELAYLENFFSFDGRTLNEIMVPKEQIITLDVDMELDGILQVLDQHDYTRYPVLSGKDRNATLGFVNTKEMLTSIAAGRNGGIEQFLHHIPRVKQSMFIQDVFLKMKQTRTHIAIVTDAKGIMIGLVTMEDILTEIVGKMEDVYEGTEGFAT
ncbi:hemolysin [Bacillus sp. JCM 19046]|uniref:CBS domain containing-hemolysin-like protein n=1 Tax=Shouchella xiaoxiensis TaxID=766895 RepID=A0ABS2SUJ9_9BACI|nr:hemolysin family protein [Shouchella xiaoxiensis]MBM7839188.1 CBS domain containing-hemolysin-like protein [Shouchella xiaoxiensis]GAF15133.1 hemolysin [Bacillus sp. JCM 19045]GAF15776.1 hemolysin [Bacillus sp. JCM 19046]